MVFLLGGAALVVAGYFWILGSPVARLILFLAIGGAWFLGAAVLTLDNPRPQNWMLLFGGLAVIWAVCWLPIWVRRVIANAQATVGSAAFSGQSEASEGPSEFVLLPPERR